MSLYSSVQWLPEDFRPEVERARLRPETEMAVGGVNVEMRPNKYNCRYQGYADHSKTTEISIGIHL